MPVGIGFENSSLKASFSLSSLPASEQTPDNKGVKPRLYNSLTKNRVKATAVRRSWGSTASDHREEFWSVLQANYNYIMDNQLIDNCQEVDSDLSGNTGTWSLKEFYSQFSELYSWLNSVQETIYGKEENITDKALRAYCVNMVLEKSSSLKLFNDQASQLVQLYPEVQEEVSWRATHLNSKWDSILSILGPSDCDHCDQDSCLDIDNELKCLRQWFKVMESRLEPLDFRAKYSKTEIDTKALELNVLHRDIENHGKIVGSVVKLCKRTDTKCNTINARRIANGLERRWHLLFLRSLEWQCYLESLSKKQNLRNSASSEDSDSDCYREPASKYPRLSGKERSRKFRTIRYSDQNNSSSENDYCNAPNDNGMTDTTSKLSDKEDAADVVDGNFKDMQHSAEFTKSDKLAPNLATYYFKHEDTDSDMDKIEQNSKLSVKSNGQSTTIEETSEEEWTFTKNEEEDKQKEEIIEPHMIKPKIIPEEKIRKLVQEAEELISRKNSVNKHSRIKNWLSMEKPDDSCDASGEDDEQESQTSEDLETSTMTLKEGQNFNSSNTCFDEMNTPKDGSSDWCGSFMSQLHDVSNATVINNFSISESALNKMNLTPKILERLTTSLSSNFNINSTNSTSSTMEEVSPLVLEKTSPIRRKKSKLKKKSLFGKSDTYLLHSPTSTKHRHFLIKSGSFSGYSSKSSFNEKHSTSDPSTVKHGIFCETSTTTSGGESEDEFLKRLPHFKPGQKTRYLCAPELRDTSPGKSSLNTTEEQSSSLSEAWDNYQENYLSEAYSEAHDSDAARKLLNFGEDYRNFIDSQSDWSYSDVSPKMKRRSWIKHINEDSNSEDESFRQLLGNAKDQLVFAEKMYSQVKGGFRNLVNMTHVDELLSSCDRHIGLLHHINQSQEEFKLTPADKTLTTGLLTSWLSLRNKTAKFQEYRKLQKQIIELKMFITTINVGENRRIFTENYPTEDVQNEIELYTKLLETILERGEQLSHLNANVHRFTLDVRYTEDFAGCSLKAEISELYELFEDARTSTRNKLCQLESLLPMWKTLETRLEQLQKDLKEDEKTIHQIDCCLINGTFTYKTASSARDVAKVLSETTVPQGYSSLQEMFTEGSFSDSGISDEGSEHEIGERQGRLAAIRRLVRQLEVWLSPDSKARLMMREKLNAAEDELKTLQERCRSLIARTAASSTLPCENQRDNENSTSSYKKDEKEGVDSDNDPVNSPKPQSWFKRMFNASVAFQLVILTFVCLTCLFQPQCCDNMNNYSWWFGPKLHYQGRPPM